MTSKQVLVKAKKISDITPSKLNVAKKKNNYRVPISYEDAAFVFQTPYLKVNVPIKKTPHPNISQLETSFHDNNQNDILFEFIETIESCVCEQVRINGLNWFNDNDNVMIKSLIKERDLANGKFYFIKWPIDVCTNIFVDVDKNEFDYSLLTDNHQVKMIVEIPYLWIKENQFGLAIRVQKIMVKNIPENLETEYVFDESDSDDNSNGNGYSSDDKDNSIVSFLATEQKYKPKCDKVLRRANDAVIKQLPQINDKRAVPKNNETKPINTSVIDYTRPNMRLADTQKNNIIEKKKGINTHFSDNKNKFFNPLDIENLNYSDSEDFCDDDLDFN